MEVWARYAFWGFTHGDETEVCRGAGRRWEVFIVCHFVSFPLTARLLGDDKQTTLYSDSDRDQNVGGARVVCHDSSSDGGARLEHHRWSSGPVVHVTNRNKSEYGLRKRIGTDIVSNSAVKASVSCLLSSWATEP